MMKIIFFILIFIFQPISLKAGVSLEYYPGINGNDKIIIQLDKEFPYKVFTIKILSELVGYYGSDSEEFTGFCKLLSITPDQLINIEDRLGLHSPDTPITFEMLKNGLSFVNVDKSIDDLKKSIPSALSENCIYVGEKISNYQEIQTSIDHATDNNDLATSYEINGKLVPLPLAGRKILEGNCQSYAFTNILGYKGNRPNNFMKDIEKVMKACTFDYVEENSRPIKPNELKDGDWVFYPGEKTEYDMGGHWGVVRFNEGKMFIESKWGSGPLRHHQLHEVPSVYGGVTCFMRLSEDAKAKVPKLKF